MEVSESPWSPPPSTQCTPAHRGGRSVPASLMLLGAFLLLFLDGRRAIGRGPVGEGGLVTERFLKAGDGFRRTPLQPQCWSQLFP